MNEITHKQARSFLQQGALRPAEREALQQHLSRCEPCRQYQALTEYLSQHLSLDVDVPQLSGEQRRALAARMEQQVRRKQTMNQMMSVVRPVAWVALFVAVVLVAAGIFSTMRAPVAEPEAAAVVAGSAPEAQVTATMERGLAHFEVGDGSVTLLEGNATTASGETGGVAVAVTVAWSWRGEPTSVSYFVHLIDEQGALLNQADHPLSPAAAANSLTSQERLELPAAAAPSVVEVWIGLYDGETGERLQTASGETAVMVGAVAFDEDGEEAPAGATATPFPATMMPPAGIVLELEPVDLRGQAARAHPQVSERFALGVDEALEAVSFPVWLPSRLPAGLAFIGAEVSNGQATFIFGPESDDVGLILTLEQRPDRPFRPGVESGMGQVAARRVPESDALYFANGIMAALAWEEGEMAFEWTATPGELSLETLQELAASLEVAE